ncbi:coiled-coil domain-containing protein 121-like [Psammomys obesus]|uniref:coiled-coil domain-containing protein 121-like n=1 Tax=Psammomys obesus TaxID=48139 RepID=UPI002452CFF4|nr:coiled-coil domain-containing protein 121-like [Psammomys obesus]
MGGAASPKSLTTSNYETVLKHQNPSCRACLTRKKATCDFRVKWPELIFQDQKKKEMELPQTGQSAPEKLVPVASTCSSGVSITNIDLQSSPSEIQDFKGGFAVGRQTPPSEAHHVTIFNSFLKPASMTKQEKMMRRKTMAAMSKMHQEMEAVKSRRSVLMRDIRETQTAISLEEEEHKPLLEYLKQKKEESDRKYDSLWKDYTQQCQEIEVKRRELLNTFSSRTANLKNQLLKDRMLDATLRKKLKALRPVVQLKQSQNKKIQDLEKEEASILANTPFMDRERHFQFLKDRAALEKQMEELNLLELGENLTRKLKKKAKALETTANHVFRDFCKGMYAESKQLQTQLHQLDQDFSELEARRQKLEQRKQQWKEQHWYLEALARGRQRLQQRERRTPKPQAAPQPIQSRLLGARPKTNPK